MDMKKTLIALGTLLLTTNATAAGGDDPMLAKVMIDRFERQHTAGDDPLMLEADVWIGRDLHKLWFKTEVERVGAETEEAEIQALYSRAIAPYWDLQVGWRHDALPKPERDWLAVGFNGLAPYWFEIDAAAFVGGNGQVAARFTGEYEWLFTQRLILSPELEMNLHGKDDPATGVGAGVSDLELGLRLRYEMVREFAPYVGINWKKKFGDTADFARDHGEDPDDVQVVVGFRAWF